MSSGGPLLNLRVCGPIVPVRMCLFFLCPLDPRVYSSPLTESTASSRPLCLPLGLFCARTGICPAIGHNSSGAVGGARVPGASFGYTGVRVFTRRGEARPLQKEIALLSNFTVAKYKRRRGPLGSKRVAPPATHPVTRDRGQWTFLGKAWETDQDNGRGRNTVH